MPIHRIAMVPSAAIFLLTLTITAFPVAAAGQKGVARPAMPGRLDVRLLDLAAIRRLVNALIRNGSTLTEGERAAAWSDVALVSQAVIGGDTRVGPFDLAEIAQAAPVGAVRASVRRRVLSFATRRQTSFWRLDTPPVKPPMS